MMAIYAFIYDITKPDERAFRYGMLHLASTLGRPIAAPIGAYLLRTGGYVWVFCTSLAGIVIGSVFLLIRIHSYKWKPEKKDKVN
jgi:MFS family permease